MNMASKMLKPQLALARRQMASMAVKKVDGPSKIHQVEVSDNDVKNAVQDVKRKFVKLSKRRRIFF